MSLTKRVVLLYMMHAKLLCMMHAKRAMDQ
jgi:hypothetical protein